MDYVNFTGLWGRNFVYSFIVLFPKGNILYNPNSWMGGTQELHEN